MSDVGNLRGHVAWALLALWSDHAKHLQHIDTESQTASL